MPADVDILKRLLFTVKLQSSKHTRTNYWNFCLEKYHGFKRDYRLWWLRKQLINIVSAPLINPKPQNRGRLVNITRHQLKTCNQPLSPGSLIPPRNSKNIARKYCLHWKWLSATFTLSNSCRVYWPLSAACRDYSWTAEYCSLCFEAYRNET